MVLMLIPASSSLKMTAIRASLEHDIKEDMLSQGMEPFISSPEQFAALMKADMAKSAGIVKAANIKQLD